MTASPLIQLWGVTRSYGGVVALRDLNLEILPGEVHALCGENGAGKSTLIRVLAGIVPPDEGEILVAGCRLEPGRVDRSEEVGIAVMHQESTAFPDLDAVDNVFVGRELTWARGLLLDRRGAARPAPVRRSLATLLTLTVVMTLTQGVGLVMEMGMGIGGW